MSVGWRKIRYRMYLKLYPEMRGMVLYVRSVRRYHTGYSYFFGSERGRGVYLKPDLDTEDCKNKRHVVHINSVGS
jgi:hypothetical protein